MKISLSFICDKNNQSTLQVLLPHLGGPQPEAVITQVIFPDALQEVICISSRRKCPHKETIDIFLVIQRTYDGQGLEGGSNELSQKIAELGLRRLIVCWSLELKRKNSFI